MKYIDISNITTTLGMRLKSGTIDWLQTLSAEVAQAIIWGLYQIPPDDNTNYYVLQGVERSGSNPYTVSRGVIYYNGNLYFVDANTYTLGGGQTDIVQILQTNTTDSEHDPVRFTDGTTKNVHYEKRGKVTNGTSGSGDVDFANLITVGKWHEVGTSGEPAFETPVGGSTWTNENAGTDSTAAFVKVGNMVYLKGNVQTTDSGSGIYSVFTLPSGYRPTKIRRYICLAVVSAANTFFGVAIKADGKVAVEAANNTNISRLNLDGISFYLD